MALNPRAKQKIDNKYDQAYEIIEDLNNGHYRVRNNNETIDVPANFLKLASKEAYEELQNAQTQVTREQVHQDDLRDSTYGEHVVPVPLDATKHPSSKSSSKRVDEDSDPADFETVKITSRRQRQVKPTRR